MKVYLDEPIVIAGIKITHTEQGLTYLIEHYQAMLEIKDDKRRTPEVTQHMEKLIENWKQHLELYSRHRKEAPG